MTPTLFGRWQTRIFLLATVGVLVTTPFGLGWVGPGSSPVFFRVLGYVALLGCGWDVVYNSLQTFRWDRDWPGLLQLSAGIWEALCLVGLIRLVGLPGIAGNDIRLSWFVIHYGAVWLMVYVASQTVMRILFPRWRFRGGQLF